MPYLLDTNTCIDAMRHRREVVDRMAAQPPDQLAISTITIYELYTGVEKCKAPEVERAKVDALLRTIQEAPFNSIAAREAARIRGVLESRGEMIGPYDVLLAAQALSAGLTLVSANTGEFSSVDGLSLENWRLADG